MGRGSACLLVPVFSALGEAGTRSQKVEKKWSSRPILSDFPLVLLDPNLLVVIRIMLKQSHEVAYAWVQGRCRQVLSPPNRAENLADRDQARWKRVRARRFLNRAVKVKEVSASAARVVGADSRS